MLIVRYKTTAEWRGHEWEVVSRKEMRLVPDPKRHPKTQLVLRHIGEVLSQPWAKQYLASYLEKRDRPEPQHIGRTNA